MTQEVSVRELRNNTANVVAVVKSGETVVLTANHRPIADIVPHVVQRDAWISSGKLREIVADAPADQGLLADLADVRGSEVSDK